MRLPLYFNLLHHPDFNLTLLFFDCRGLLGCLSSLSMWNHFEFNISKNISELWTDFYKLIADCWHCTAYMELEIKRRILVNRRKKFNPWERSPWWRSSYLFLRSLWCQRALFALLQTTLHTVWNQGVMSHIDCADDQRSFLDTVASRVLTHSLTHQNPSPLICCCMHGHATSNRQLASLTDF